MHKYTWKNILLLTNPDHIDPYKYTGEKNKQHKKQYKL